MCLRATATSRSNIILTGAVHDTANVRRMRKLLTAGHQVLRVARLVFLIRRYVWHKVLFDNFNSRLLSNRDFGLAFKH